MFDYMQERLAHVFVTFIAVPPDFDITLYMSPAEQAGYFRYEGANPENITAISMGICNSPIFSTDTTRINEDSIQQFIKILKDLGLVIDMKMFGAAINTYYEQIVEKALSVHEVTTAQESIIQTERHKALSTLRNNRYAKSFVFINLFPLVNIKEIHKYVERVVALEDWRKK
jgi:hypothetical protein